MMLQTWVNAGSFDSTILRLIVATALGLFMGLEREWSNKAAGVRTFALTSLAAATFAILGRDVLLAVGGLLTLIHAVLLGGRGLLEASAGGEGSRGGLSLTTSVSLLVAYGVGILVAEGLVLEGVTVALLSSLLLSLRGELHGFANQLSKAEVTSAAEFAILAFVIYPLLPTESVGPWGAIQPRTVWLLVVAVSAIGFANYVVMRKYGERGIAITGFFGGLVNSTAVIGEIAARARDNEDLLGIAVGTILLADAAMAIRNLVIVVAFIPAVTGVLAPPLFAISVAGVFLALRTSDWGGNVDVDFESPFSLRNALKFGLLFLVILVLAAGARQSFGAAGFIATSFLGGIVSSGSTTTTAVTLFSAGQIDAETAAAGVIAGTVASILVKIWLAAAMHRSLLRPVSLTSAGLIGAGTAAWAVAFQVV